MKKEKNYHEKFKSFYASQAWKDLRAMKFADTNGLCEVCAKKGVIRQGIEAHHIVPIERDWNKRLDYENLILLCRDCHNEQHGRESELQKFLKTWDEI